PGTPVPRQAPRTGTMQGVRGGVVTSLKPRSTAEVALEKLVPVARDGSWFSPDLERSSGYTIGAKGDECVVIGYEQALAQLRLMAVPRWRRPNGKGNWGIVAGVEWKPAGQLAR